MDPLTHTFLGAVLADTGLKRRSALAAATLVAGANLPDVDVLAYVRGPDAALGFRRGWTHGVLAWVVLPVVLTLLMTAIDRLRRRYGHDGPPVRPRELLLLAALAVWSHPLLDWLNTYGIRLLMPFDGRWYYGDTLFIVDPWIWLLFGGVLFLNHSEGVRPLLNWGALALVATAFVFLGAGPHDGARWLWAAVVAGLVLVRVRRRHPPRHDGRGFARAALAVAALYVAGMAGVTAWAEAEVRSGLRAAGIEAADGFMAGPDRLDPFARVVVVPTADAYRFGSFHLWRRPRFELDEAVIPLSPHESPPPGVVAAARAAPCVRGMVGWVRYPFYEVDDVDEGYAVFILDARYVRGRTRGFGGAAVSVGRDLRAHCELE